MSVSTMVVSVIGKKVIDDNGVDGVIVRLGYSGTEDKELAHNIKELNRLEFLTVFISILMLKMRPMLRMMLIKPLNS